MWGSNFYSFFFALDSGAFARRMRCRLLFQNALSLNSLRGEQRYVIWAEEFTPMDFMPDVYLPVDLVTLGIYFN